MFTNKCATRQLSKNTLTYPKKKNFTKKNMTHQLDKYTKNLSKHYISLLKEKKNFVVFKYFFIGKLENKVRPKLCVFSRMRIEHYLTLLKIYGK